MMEIPTNIYHMDSWTMSSITYHKDGIRAIFFTLHVYAIITIECLRLVH